MKMPVLKVRAIPVGVSRSAVYAWVVAAAMLVVAASAPAHAEPSFSASATTVALPEGPGSIAGMGEEFDVSPNTGLASYGLGFPVPPGPGGLVPSVRLSYSSGAPNSALGVGWSMGASRICRRTDAGLPLYGPADPNDSAGEHHDLFAISGAVGSGELVHVPEWSDAEGEWWGLREEGAFLRARPDDDSGDLQGWLVEAPDGTLYRFGNMDDAREGPGPESFDTSSCWTLREKEDVWGHVVSYAYRRDGGRLYLEEIRYAEDTPSPRSVRFTYESRADVHADYRFDFKRTYGLRLRSIEAVVENSQHTGGDRILATMQLSYQESWNSSRLAGLSLTGEYGEELPSQSFVYEEIVPEGAESYDVDAPGIPPTLAGHRLVDVDGDSFPDLLRATATGWEYYRNEQGNGLSASPTAVVNPPSFNGTTADWLMVDLDGDGLRDVVFRPGGGQQLRGYRNVSALDGSPAEFAYMGELGVSTPVALSDPSLRFVDLNLDRRLDILLSPGNGQLSSSLSRVVRDADGVVRSDSDVSWDGLQGISERVPGAPASGVAGLAAVDLSVPGVQLAEMNGDGLDDLVRILGGGGNTTSIIVHPGEGLGAFGEGYALQNLPAGIRGASPEDVQISDINTDGLGDVVVAGVSQVRYWLNVGGRRLSEPYSQTVPSRSAFSELVFSDFNGNASVDFVIVEPSEGVWSIVDPIGEQPTGLLIEARNGMGGVYTMDYRSLAAASRDAGDAGMPWRTWIPQPMHVVTTSGVSDSRGWEGLSRRLYRDPAWSTEEGAFRGFAGASVELVGDDRAPSRFTDYVFYTGVGKEARDFGSVLGAPQGYFPQEDLKILSGRARSVVQRTEDGRLYGQQLTAWRVRRLDGGRSQALVTSALSIGPELALMAPAPGDWLGVGAHFDGTPRTPEDGEQARWRTLTDFEHDNWGNVTRQIEWGYVAADGTDIPGDERVSQTEYINSTAPWRIGVAWQQEVLSGSGDVLSSSRTLFDGDDFTGLGPGEIARGAPTRTQAWLDEGGGSGRWVDTARHARDTDGNITSTLDALGHRVDLEYDDVIRALPVRETVRLDVGAYSSRRTDSAPDTLTTTANYDTDRGLATTLTDFNGVESRVVYDGLGRMSYMVAPGDSDALPTVSYSYSFGDPVSSLDVSQREVSGEDGTIDTRAYVDGLGRAIATLTEAPDGRSTVTDMTEYTASGDPWIAWHAFEQQGFELPTSVPERVPSVDTFYDAVGRTRRVTFEDGSFTRTTYLPGRVVSYDPNDVDPASPHLETPSIVTSDGLGRAIEQVLTLADGESRVFRNTWDARDLLKSRALPDAEVRSWTHDSLGRVRSATDPNAGTQRRTYDDLGHVIAQENATGELVVSRHDAVGRLWEVALSTVADPGNEEIIARYRYDVAGDEFPANYALGRLTARYESAFDSFLDYDARGQLVRSFREMEGKVYVSGARYDAAGRVTDNIYSDGSSLAVEYDAQSRPIALPGIVDEVLYNEDGTVASMRYGNGVARSHVFDERLQMQRYTLNSPVEGTIFDLEVTYDRSGVPQQLTDLVTPSGALSQTRSWDYDALYRPSQMRAESVGVVNYGFDTGGSLVRRALEGAPTDGAEQIRELDSGDIGVGGTAPDGLFAGPHHVTRLETPGGSRHLGYDPNGQLVLDRREAASGAGDSAYVTGDRDLYWDAAGRLREVSLPDGRRVEFRYNGGFDRMERVLRAPDRSIGERTVYLSPAEELRWSGGTFHYRKTATLGGERVADVRSERDPGRDADTYDVPEVAPWAVLGGDVDGGLAPDSWHDVPPVGPPLALPVVGTPALMLALLAALLALAGVLGAAVVQGTARDAGRRALAALLATLMPVVGLPGCGAPGNNTPRDTEPDWEPASSFVSEGDDVVYYHAPLLGTPAIQTDADGAVYNRQSSTPYGIRTGHEGASSDEFRFTDKEWDDDLGLIYFGARYYDPGLGTWISVDPMALWGDGGELAVFNLNPLGYVGGRVTIAVDLFGFEGIDEGGAVYVYGFAVDSAELPADAGSWLTTLADRHPDAAFYIVGTASRTGGSEYNLALSHLRAETTAQALIDLGVRAENIVVVEGEGDASPRSLSANGVENPLDRAVFVVAAGASNEAPQPSDSFVPSSAYFDNLFRNAHYTAMYEEMASTMVDVFGGERTKNLERLAGSIPGVPNGLATMLGLFNGIAVESVDSLDDQIDLRAHALIQEFDRYVASQTDGYHGTDSEELLNRYMEWKQTDSE